MKIIKDNTQPKIEICGKCGSTLECSPADYTTHSEYVAQTNYQHSIGVEYFDCPYCGHRNYKRCTLDDVNLLADKNKN